MAAATQSYSTYESSETMQDRLDDLWAQYLQLLDEYTAAQAHLKKHLASGYFSLTQANFKSSGRRYGKDFYDDRAVASTKVEVDEEAQIMISTGKDVEKQHSKGEEADGSCEMKHKISTDHDIKQLPSPGPESEGISKETTSEDKTARTINLSDPIRWFGILVPPPLRSAQASFYSAVVDETGVAKAVNTARTMREMESEIRKLRKMIKKSERVMER